MKLYDGYGIKGPRWLANEVVKNQDVNFIHEADYKNLVDLLASMYAPASASSSDADVVIGEGLRLVWTSAMTAKLQPGVAISFQGKYFTGSTWGWVLESGSIFGVVVGDEVSVSVDAGSASDRYDTIEIRPIQNLYDSKSREFRDPTTGIVTTTSVETKIEYGYEVQVLKGTSGAGVAPNHTAGWIKVAEVYVPSGASALTQANYKQVERFNDWKTQATASVRKAYGVNVTDIIHTADATLIPFSVNYANGTTRLNLTLPASSSVGNTIEVVDMSGFGFKIVQAAGQSIGVLNKWTQAGTTGYVKSKSRFASVRLVCTVANTEWKIVSIQDTWRMKGYWAGGLAATYSAKIDDFDFALESSRELSAALDVARSGAAGVAGLLKGYFGGGATGSYSGKIDDLNFSNETSAEITATLNTGRVMSSGVSGRNKGYFIGGATGSDLTIIDDMNFADETSVQITTTLGATGQSQSAPVSGSIKGYIMGGSSGLNTAKIHSLQFSDEAHEELAATLDTARSALAGLSGPWKGYAVGGKTSGVTQTIIDDLDLSAETSSVISAVLPTARQGPAGVSGLFRGFIAGGDTAGDGNSRVTTIDGFEFTTEIMVTITATIDVARWAFSGVSGYLN